MKRTSKDKVIDLDYKKNFKAKYVNHGMFQMRDKKLHNQNGSKYHQTEIFEISIFIDFLIIMISDVNFIKKH